MPNLTAIAAADRVVGDVINAAIWRGEPVVLLDSPPGAGKTGTVERAAAFALGECDLRTMIAVQTNAQAFDLVTRLSAGFPSLGFNFLTKHGLDIPSSLRARNLNISSDPRQLPGGPCAVVATAAKWAEVGGLTFDNMIVDEVYQLRDALFLQFASLSDRYFFVGDPGQLESFTPADVDRWRADPAGPHRSCVRAMSARRGDILTFRLPVSRRLTRAAVDLVRPAFYPQLPFESGTLPGERELLLPASGITGVDRALNRLRDGVGWGYLELPHAVTGMVDEDVANSLAELVHALLDRGAMVRDENGLRPLVPERIGVGCAHVAQTTAVAKRLRGPIARGVTVETANRLQGREFDVTLVYHPLAGRMDVSEFHLDSGRLCVLLSRHRVGCVVVGRAGTRDLLAGHSPSSERILGLDEDSEHEGWVANLAVLDRLSDESIRVRR